MSTSNERAYSRRLFLQQGMTLASMAVTAPLFIERSARGVMMPLDSAVSSRPGVPEDRVLVVVQLGGGNDGLNTVIPYYSDAYYRSRPGLAIAGPKSGGGGQASAIDLDPRAGLGLHPSFRGFKELIDKGVASIVQGVGYPNPNRSHFTSMDIWHTADTNAHGPGWIGRFFDNTCAGMPRNDEGANQPPQDRRPVDGVAIARTAPRAMSGRSFSPVTFENADLFQWVGDRIDPALSRASHRLSELPLPEDVGENSQLAYLTRTALDARVSSETIRAATAKDSLVAYPGGRLAQHLRIVAAMIRAEMKTRVYYVSLGGFDTHANQPGTHARLLDQLGSALNAFYRDLRAQGNSGRVLTMVFSEFGRRVAQNASAGTDHGTAAPMYFVGDMVRPGVLGQHPSLTELDQGDLIYNVDFRSIYAHLIEDWMGADSSAVLGRRFERAPILRL